MIMSYGMLEGELCDRNGCNGILEDKYQKGQCTCHLGHPPCGYCTGLVGCCPVCEWNTKESIVSRRMIIEKIY